MKQTNKRIPADMVVGTQHMSNHYGMMEVVEYKGWNKVKVKFLDSGEVVIVTANAVRNGEVKDNTFNFENAHDLNIVFRNETIKIRVNEHGLYSLTDLGLSVERLMGKRTALYVWKQSKMFKELQENQENLELVVVRGVGKDAGTWGNKKAVVSFSSFTDSSFMLAVLDSFVAATEGKGDEAVAIAQSVMVDPDLCIHEMMLINKPLFRIRKWFSTKSEGTIAHYTGVFIEGMGNNHKASYEDRIRTLQSLRAYIEELYAKLHAREAFLAHAHEEALKLVAEKERYLARRQAARK